MQQTQGLSRGANGDGIAWCEWGDAAADSLVLLHGVGNQTSSLFDLPERFAARGWHVLAVDLRGHGRSIRTGPYSLEQFVSDVCSVLHERGVARPVLVGHSLGALVCTAMAAIPAVGARAIVNVDQSLKLLEFSALIRPLWSSLRSDFAQTIWPLFETMMPEGLTLDVRETLHQDYLAMNAEAALAVWAPLIEWDPQLISAAVDQMLAGIHTPYLAVHGVDPGGDYHSWLCDHVPSAQVDVFEGGRHFPHLRYPDRFVSRVEQFAQAA